MLHTWCHARTHTHKHTHTHTHTHTRTHTHTHVHTCYLLCAVCFTPHALFHVPRALSCVLHTPCSVSCATCYVLCAMCFTLHAPFHMPRAVCCVLYTPCYTLAATCFVLYASHPCVCLKAITLRLNLSWLCLQHIMPVTQLCLLHTHSACHSTLSVLHTHKHTHILYLSLSSICLTYTQIQTHTHSAGLSALSVTHPCFPCSLSQTFYMRLCLRARMSASPFQLSAQGIYCCVR